MKISLEWLGEWIEWIERDPQLIAERLTLCTAEVEEVKVQGELLEHCCVGRIASLKPHPNASRLQLAEVETDRGTVGVVCGGTNLREGMMVAFAHVGARVRHGAEMVTLSEVEIRGTKSRGMICAAEELDLGDRFPPKPEDGERPVIDLGRDATCHVSTLTTGTSLRSVLGLTDTILTISNTAITHRSDLFSHIGFARECVALGLARWKQKKEPLITLPKFPKTPMEFAIKNTVPTLIPRYVACTLTIDAPGETPEWMRRRLEATGWRSISLPVDITNYVMMEVGVPLHSFNVDDLKGDLVMREAKEGEHIVTLDKEDRALMPGAIVISDDLGVFDLLGIMGGLRSSTRETSRSLLLHSAALNPARIHRTIVAMGHRTDAGTTFEKGVANVTATRGFARALQLFLELVPGARITSSLQSSGTDGKSRVIALPVKTVERVLGVRVSALKIKTVLTALGCSVRQKSHDVLAVTIPLHRLADLQAPIDVIEEVGRLIGYDTVSEAMPNALVRVPEGERRPLVLRRSLQSLGYTEIMPLSFVSEELLRRCSIDPARAITISNPLGAETALLQPSTVPHLLTHGERSMVQRSEALRTFHLGRVFSQDHEEHTELSMLLVEPKEEGILQNPFLSLKRDLEESLASIGLTATFNALSTISSLMHPGRSAKISVKNTDLGSIFELHPLLARSFSLPGHSAIATINVTALLAIVPAKPHPVPPPSFPAIQYDLTFDHPASGNLRTLLMKVKDASPLLESIDIVDLYSDPKANTTITKVTLRFTYRASDRTLKEDEAKKAHEEVTRKMEEGR